MTDPYDEADAAAHKPYEVAAPDGSLFIDRSLLTDTEVRRALRTAAKNREPVTIYGVRFAPEPKRDRSGLVEECDRFGVHRRGHHETLARARYVPEHLPAAVREYRYKPGWLFYLDYATEPDGAGGLTLWIMSDTENSLAPGRINVHHPFLVPLASYKREVWDVWIANRLGDVEMHERNEFIQINGERVFAPHHGNGEDPYITWHHGTEEARAKRAGED